MSHEFKVGDKVRVTKKRCPDFNYRNGVVLGIKCGLVLVEHNVQSFGIVNWFPESLELNDHREPCACFECAE